MDCLLFGTDIKETHKFIKNLEENGYNLTCEDIDEDNVFSILGVSITQDKYSKMPVLTQNGHINNI